MYSNPSANSLSALATCLRCLLAWVCLEPLIATAITYPLRVSPGHRYLEDQTGAPVLVHADSPWSLIVGLTKEEAEIYLEDRRKKGFNTLIVELIEHQFGGPLNRYGQGPFLTPGNFSTPNEAYFSHADWVLQKAAEKGMNVILTPCYLGYPGTSEGWYNEVLSNGTAGSLQFGRYVGARYRNQPNIIWMMVGDRNPESARPMVNPPDTFGPLTFRRSRSHWFQAPWLRPTRYLMGMRSGRSGQPRMAWRAIRHCLRRLSTAVNSRQDHETQESPRLRSPPGCADLSAKV